MAKQRTEFAVAITNLSSGDDLLCFKTVDVHWEKPHVADVATVELTCNCSQHAGGGAMTCNTPTMGLSNTGTCNFNLNHASTINEPGRTVTAVIKNGGGVGQMQDP